MLPDVLNALRGRLLEMLLDPKSPLEMVLSYWFPIEGLMDDPTVDVTTDPAGEIRVFVYSSTTGEGGGQGSSRRNLGLKHEVSADRAGFR